MNKVNNPFEIQLKNPIDGELLTLFIRHETETFDFDFKGQKISIINNGDNSWSAITNNIDQVLVNAIGTAIEAYYAKLPI